MAQILAAQLDALAGKLGIARRYLRHAGDRVLGVGSLLCVRLCLSTATAGSTATWAPRVCIVRNTDRGADREDDRDEGSSCVLHVEGVGGVGGDAHKGEQEHQRPRQGCELAPAALHETGEGVGEGRGVEDHGDSPRQGVGHPGSDCDIG